MTLLKLVVGVGLLSVGMIAMDLTVEEIVPLYFSVPIILGCAVGAGWALDKAFPR